MMGLNASHYAALAALDVVCREMFVDAVGKLVSSIQMPFVGVPRARPISPRSEPQLSRCRPGFNHDLSLIIVCDSFFFLEHSFTPTHSNNMSLRVGGQRIGAVLRAQRATPSQAFRRNYASITGSNLPHDVKQSIEVGYERSITPR
jgi:hypothetical protein